MNKKFCDLENQRDMLMAEIVDMKNEMAILESIKIEHLEDREKLAALYSEGLIDESGNPVGGK